MHRILNLVLFSDNDNYYKMYEITRNIYKKQNVKTIYYKFQDDLEDDFCLEDDLLKIKGTETFLPGILNKTLKALEYCMQNFETSFDYIMRSNISTVINFNYLISHLQTQKIQYGGGLIYNLQWIDYPCGVLDNSFFGLKFVSGCSILMSKYFISLLLSNKDKINYKIQDDLSLALFAKNFNIIPKHIGDDSDFVFITSKLDKGEQKWCVNIYLREFQVKCQNLPNSKNRYELDYFLKWIPITINKNNKTIFYRNKNLDRKIDIENIKFLEELYFT